MALDSPIVTLGALAVAGNSSRGRQFTGGESGKGLLAGGFAASSSEYVADQARSMAGIDTTSVSDELMQALLGAGVSRFGDPIPMNNAMARGIHYNVATQAFQDAGLSLGNLVGDVTDGGGSNGGTSGVQKMHKMNTQGAHRGGMAGGDNIDWA